MDEAQFMQALQSDLASEFTAISHYVTYAATLRGINRPELKELFEEEAADELGHAQFFADKIAVLGGQPQIVARPANPTSDPVEMLTRLLELEVQTVQNYSQRADQAAQLGLHALSVDIENILTDELAHRDELAMILGSV